MTTIHQNSQAFAQIHEKVEQNRPYFSRLASPLTATTEISSLFEAMTGQALDGSVAINLPFYTDYGANISIGKDVFINTGVMFTDLGGITIEDRVLIGPFAKLLTVNHPLNPAERRGLELKPIVIKENAWIGAGATILPGVTVGENAVVSADAIVTKDVPANTLVAGSPAKIMRHL